MRWARRRRRYHVPFPQAHALPPPLQRTGDGRTLVGEWNEAAFFSFSSEVEETTREGGNSGGGGGNSNCPIYRYATQRAERVQLNENVLRETRAEKRKIENREGDRANQRLDLIKGVLW